MARLAFLRTMHQIRVSGDKYFTLTRPGCTRITEKNTCGKTPRIMVGLGKGS
jgi:hypothetical protein